MGWSVSSFNPGDTAGVAAKLTAVMSDFFSLMMQESGAPKPGIWTVNSGIASTQMNSLGSLNISSIFMAATLNASGYQVQAQSAQLRVGYVYAQRTASDINSTQVFSTFIVASYAPKFADSILTIRANFNAAIIALVTASEIHARVNLCRAPNGTAVVLTDSSATAYAMGVCTAGFNNQTRPSAGAIAFNYQETSPGSGVATQYGIRYAPLFVTNSGYINTIRGDILVEEWR